MKHTLFDIDEGYSKRKKKPAPEAEEPEFVSPERRLTQEEISYIGTVDGVACADSACWCRTHDITQTGLAVLGDGAKDRERLPAWRVQCFWCGTAQWIAPVDDRFEAHVEPESQKTGEIIGFTFDDGPFAGMTPAEVCDQYGRDTLSMLANDRRHPTWRDPCHAHLATHQPTRYATASDNQDGA